MSDQGTILIGQSTKREELYLRFANRHGLVTGATGTGKTVTLQILAEGFSDAGVPVFAAGMKGGLSGISAWGAQGVSGRAGPDDRARAPRQRQLSRDLLAPFGQRGHPIRATVTEIGPLLLARLMNLTEAQEGVLNIAFRAADEEGLLLLDLKDLQAILTFVAENAQARQRRARLGRGRPAPAPGAREPGRRQLPSHRSRSPISCARRATGAATSRSLPPTS